MFRIHITTLLIAWGALAFGAVYPWAYAPIVAVVLTIAAWTWRPWRSAGLVMWTALLLLASIAAQLVPLAAATLSDSSPAADRIVKGLDVAYAIGVAPSHPLSIQPDATLRALGFAALWMIWAPACASLLERRSSAARLLARNITIVGTCVALVGLAQKATFNGKLLWFWTPQFFATNGFGPFVNRNHFAGWMLLALAISVGYLFGQVSRSPLAPGAGWRERILWAGSPAAMPVVLTSVASIVMACALVWTMSRSGIVAAGAAMGVLFTAGLWRARGGVQRWVLAGYLLCAVIGVVAWRGTDTLAGWYGRTATLEWRLQLWNDTLPALEEFRITGSGMNTYSTLMLTQPHHDHKTHPNAAHNDYLQLAVEGGVLVVIPALLLLMATGRSIVGRLRAAQEDMTWWIRMGAVAGMCGIGVQEISEFSLQIPGVALLFATSVAIAVHAPAATHARRHSKHGQRSEAVPTAA